MFTCLGTILNSFCKCLSLLNNSYQLVFRVRIRNYLRSSQTRDETQQQLAVLANRKDLTIKLNFEDVINEIPTERGVLKI